MANSSVRPVYRQVAGILRTFSFQDNEMGGKNPVSSIFSFKKKMLLYSIILAGLCRLYSSSLSVLSYVASLNKACEPAIYRQVRSVQPKLQGQ